MGLSKDAKDVLQTLKDNNGYMTVSPQDKKKAALNELKDKSIIKMETDKSGTMYCWLLSDEKPKSNNTIDYKWIIGAVLIPIIAALISYLLEF